MVYVIDGVAHEGHKPRGPQYEREATKFSLPTGQPLDLADETDLHLFVCAACPWAHRTLLTRNLSKTLREKITLSVVSPFRDDARGWEFRSKANEEAVSNFGGLPVTEDRSPLKAKTLLDVYLSASPSYTGNITTPTLYEATSNNILGNDSFGLMRNLVATVPGELGHLYELAMAEEIDEEGCRIDAELCNRVYMCGLARTQEAYEENLGRVVAELDRLEEKLSDGRSYLLGSMTLVDLQLVACLVRFDPVYFSLFKCFHRRIASYPFLSAYLKRATEAIGPEAMSLDLEQIVHHYYTTFTSANPKGTVPIGYRHDFLDGGRDRYTEESASTGVGDDNNDAAAADVAGAGVNQDQTDAERRRATGEYVRGVSAFRHELGGEDFPLDEEGRYVLFVANNCPWCHRTLLARSYYEGLGKFVKASTMFYRRGDDGWRFLPSDATELRKFEIDRRGLLEGIDREDPTGNGFACARDIYRLRDPSSTEKSVPILFDTKTGRVVSNESADIVAMFARAAGAGPPEGSRAAARIEAINARVYQEINNGAYRAGFSSNQASYEDAAAGYFRALSWLDGILSSSRYLAAGDEITAADLRLFPTIFRHDPVYYSRMNLNVAMVKDYPHLNRWFRDLAARPSIQKASRLEHCSAGYFGRTGNKLVPFVGLDHDGIRDY